MHKLKRYLWLSQIHLFVWMTVCSLMVSSVVFRNGGVSNYGNHYSSLVPYTLAFGLNIVYLYLASESLLLLNRRFKYMARCMTILCAMTLAVYVSTFPRRFGIIFSDIHDNISLALFGYELLLALWMLTKRPKRDTIACGLVMLVGLFIGLLSTIHTIHCMFVGQMVGALGFGLLLVLVFPKIIAAELEKLPSKS